MTIRDEYTQSLYIFLAGAGPALLLPTCVGKPLASVHATVFAEDHSRIRVRTLQSLNSLPRYQLEIIAGTVRRHCALASPARRRISAETNT